MFDQQSAEEQQTKLLRRIAAHDRQALGEFYDQVAGALFSTSVRVLSDAHEAEEVIQDVFVQIWDKAAMFDPKMGAPFHWALSITRNRSIDRLRARQRRTRLMGELEEAAAHNSAPESFSSQNALGDDELAVVRSAVGGLPRDQRQAIEMAFFGGLTHLEIAESLKEPLGTIKARIRRGMLKLKEGLEELEIGKVK
jgi:RNA polymerase sigma-70 factor (ECF subfamily)